MKKKLITLENVDEIIFEGELNMTKDMILLAKVNDYLKNKGIKIKYISKKSETLEERIKFILKNSFNLLDDKINDEVIKKIKGSINHGN
ncbi:MAG: hypothetical protein ACRC6A_03415 [Fusobacteriaceae bacterium]